MKGNCRRTHWHPERQFENIQGSLREGLNASDAASGSFGVIRTIAVPTGRWRDDRDIADQASAAPGFRSTYFPNTTYKPHIAAPRISPSIITRIAPIRKTVSTVGHANS
jgi:hypothetical protein